MELIEREQQLKKLADTWSGDWDMNELITLRKGVVDLSRAMGGLNKFIHNLGYVNVYKERINSVAAGGKITLK